MKRCVHIKVSSLHLGGLRRLVKDWENVLDPEEEAAFFRANKHTLVFNLSASLKLFAEGKAR